MKMPSPMAQTTYDEINSELHNAYVGTAQESMEKAAHEICDLESQKLDDTASTTEKRVGSDFAMSGAKGKSSLTAKISMAVKDA